jgi:Glycosyl hydrolases family 28
VTGPVWFGGARRGSTWIRRRCQVPQGCGRFPAARPLREDVSVLAVPRMLFALLLTVIVTAMGGLGCASEAEPQAESADEAVVAANGLVQRYPTPAEAPRSTTYKLDVASVPLVVEHFRDVSFARLGIGGAVPVTITATQRVTSFRVVPASAVSEVVMRDFTLTFMLDAPANLAVTINGLEKLFLFADALETDAPVAGKNGVRSVMEFGAHNEGTLTTLALQKAIDTVAAAGGGTVLFPPGKYTTGTLVVKSHVTLYLSPGAWLKGSRMPVNYPKDPGRHENGSDTSIKDADKRFFGEFMTFSRLLFIDGATDVHIRGRGTIDGDGAFLRKEMNAVPNVIRVRNSDGVTLEDVLVRDSPAWTIHLLGAKNVTVQNLKILNDRSNLNTDGIDPDSSQNVLIDHVFIYTKDDGVCLKGTNNTDILQDVENVIVRNSVISSVDAAIKLGTESASARFHNVRFENIDVFDSDRAMSVVVRDGAAFSDILYKDIRVGVGVKHLIEQVIGERAGKTRMLGSITNLTFENIDAPGWTKPASNWTWYAQYRPDHPKEKDLAVMAFAGADAKNALDGLTLRNVRIGNVVLRDKTMAAQLAGLTIGANVANVAISETAPTAKQ